VEEQKNERLSSKQNTLAGHIVKVVTELHNEAKVNPVPYIPFQTIWFTLAEDLDGKIDDKKPHVMDTSEFFNVSKNKVGYRLREVLSGKSKAVREKNLEGKHVIVKAYMFNEKKLRRVAKKYGYELVTKLPVESPNSNILVTKLPSLPSSEGVRAPISPLKQHKKSYGDKEIVEKSLDTPQQLGKLSNSVTKTLTVQETLIQLRSTWHKGSYNDFDILIMKTRSCSREEAEQIRETWIDEGLLAYDPEGLLMWTQGRDFPEKT